MVKLIIINFYSKYSYKYIISSSFINNCTRIVNKHDTPILPIDKTLSAEHKNTSLTNIINISFIF